MEKPSVLLEELRGYVSICSGKQKQWYEKMLADAKVVKISPLSDIFSPTDIELIKTVVKPQKKECYKNATLTATLLMKRGVKYCEGKYTCHGIGLDHAFNKIGDKYFDVTAELALGKLDAEEYLVLGEYSLKQVLKVLDKQGYYGDIYRAIELKKFLKTQ